MHRFYLVTLVTIFWFTPLLAQLPPGIPIPAENFALTHPFGAPGVINIKHVAMGGASVADTTEGWHSNPAGMKSVREPTLLALHIHGSFDAIPSVNSQFYGFAYPFGNNVIKLSGITVRANGAIANTPVPLSAKVNGDYIGFEYARQINKKLSIGVGTAYQSTKSTYSVAGIGAVTELESRPKTIGGRIGGIYNLSKKVSAGFAYDNYTETVSQAIPIAPLPTQTFTFQSTAYRLGIGIKPDDQTTFLTDYERTHLKGAGTQVARRFWKVGLERKIGDFALRIGSFDSKLTGGIGIYGDHLKFSYGFTGRYDKDLPSQGGRTSHTFQVMYSF